MSVNRILSQIEQRDTPSVRWLRTAVTPTMRAKWAAEDAAIIAADRKQTEGNK